MFEKIYIRIFKRAILKVARAAGCDVDGDIIIYRREKYYVHCLYNIVDRI